MVRDRDPFGLALARLREDLRDGRFPPGAPLLTTDLAVDLNVSATPIREALSRLAGEGLVEDHRGRGVFALRYEAAELEALYHLHFSYITLALELPASGRRSDSEAAGPGDGGIDARTLRRRCEALWRTIVSRVDDGMIARAHQRVTDQLAAPRLVEPWVLEGLDAELEVLDALARKAPSPALLAAILDYHLRRRDRARALAGALRAPRPSGAL